MAKKNYLKKNKDSVFNLFMILVVFLLLALIVPAVGVGASSPALWIQIVDFFTAVQTHFAQFWMFYSFIAVVLFAYMGKSHR